MVRYALTFCLFEAKKMFKKIKFLFLTLLFILFFAMLQYFIDMKLIKLFIESSGYWAPLLFIVSYIACSLALLPALFLTIASGAMFGPYLGTFYTLIAATISALLSLLIARFFARTWVEKKSGDITKKIIEGVNKEGWHFVAFVRLVPLFPFGLVNYAFGLTQIRILPYTLTSFICMFPVSFAYSYLGFLGISSATDDANDLISTLLVSLGLFACLALLSKLLKKKTAKKIIHNFLNLLLS